MTEKNNGWYETKFFNKKTIRETNNSELGFSAEVFESIFIHRNKDDLTKTIDFLIEEFDKRWSFFKPENDHWKYEGKRRKIYDLILTRHFNPLEKDVHSTMSHIDHEIKAKVLPDLHFNVNASAYDYFIEQIKKENSKDIPYSIFRVEPSFEIVVPSLITVALGNYPWEKHKEQMWEWLQKRQRSRSELAKHPNFKLDGNIPIN